MSPNDNSPGHSPVPESDDRDATRYGPTPVATDPAATRYSGAAAGPESADPAATRYSDTPADTATLAPGASAAPASPTAGRFVLPGYEVLGELGRGGMGVVYKARHLQLGRVVALKMILSAEHAGEAELTRFRTEAEALARLQHPNIVQIFEVGEHEGRPYFALEYLEGGSLGAKLDGTPWDPRRAAALVETLARAVHAAHVQKVVHRDLKPANVLLTADGRPKVTDFGLAKKLDDAGQTRTGEVMGTPSYMAPEQAEGKGKEVGPAADVYALGAVLYELLTGRPPFKGPTALDTMLQVMADEPVPPRRLQPKTPRDLETICLKCLGKDIRRRYAGAAALAEDLAQFQAGKPINARAIGSVERAFRMVRRHPITATVTTVVVAVLIAASVSVVRSRDEAWVLAETNTRLAGSERDQRERAERTAAIADLDLGLRHCSEGDVGRGLLWLTASLRKAPTDDEHLQRVIRTNLATWSGRIHPLKAVLIHSAAVRTAVFSPDGTIVASVDSNNSIYLWEAKTGRAIRSPWRFDGVIDSLSFSGDGRLMEVNGSSGPILLETGGGTPSTKWPPGAAWWAGARDRRGWVVSLEFQRAATVVQGPDQQVRARWAPTAEHMIAPYTRPQGRVTTTAYGENGSPVLTGFADGTVQINGLSPVSNANASPGHGEVECAMVSADGRTAVTGGYDGAARLWDVMTRELIGPPLPHRSEVTSVAFTPDGQVVLTASLDGVVRLWRIARDEPPYPPITEGKAVYAVAFRPDGAGFFTGGGDRIVRCWGADHCELTSVLPLPVEPRLAGLKHTQIMAVTCSRDGECILVGAGYPPDLPWVGEAALMGKETRVFPHVGRVNAVAFSPDGRSILTGSYDGTAWLWDRTTGTPIRRFFDDSALDLPSVNAVAFSPDGRTALTAGYSRKVRRWDVASGLSLLPDLPHEGPVNCATFNGDGSLILTGSGDGVAQVWDAVTGNRNGPPLQHPASVLSAAFSPDGEIALTGSEDGAARLWDVATGKQLAASFQNEGPVYSVAFSPKRPSVVVGSATGARLWDLPNPLRGDADRLFAWAEVLSNMKLDQTGVVQVLDGLGWNDACRQLSELGGSPLP